MPRFPILAVSSMVALVLLVVILHWGNAAAKPSKQFLLIAAATLPTCLVALNVSWALSSLETGLRIGRGLGPGCRGNNRAGSVAAAAVITIANWLACDDMGTRGTDRRVGWCGGILRMGLVRGRGGGRFATLPVTCKHISGLDRFRDPLLSY